MKKKLLVAITLLVLTAVGLCSGMLLDSQLEYNQQWQAIANAGIGGPVPYVPPTTYTVVPASDTGTPEMVITIAGVGYTDMMAATHRPLVTPFDPSNIYYSKYFNMQTDANIGQAQVIEAEARYYFTDSHGQGWTANNCVQFNQVNPKGMVQAYASPTNVWANTGIVLPNFLPNTRYSIRLNYLVDTVGKTSSILSLEFNGVTYPFPSMFQKVPMVQMTPAWTPGIYDQFQLGLNAAGGGFSIGIDHDNIEWR